VTKIRRGNYVFLSWSGDHAPRHVHVYKDGKLIVKWNLEDQVAMQGEATRRVMRLLEELAQEGKL
jgi:protein-tyrosine phosphatase